MRGDFAYDGKITREFAPGGPGNIMLTKKGLIVDDLKLNEDEFITGPYSFVRNGKGLPFTYFRDLADPKTFTKLDMIDSRPIEVTVDGEKYLCLSFKAGLHEYSKKPLIRRVYFSERNGYYPMISELVHEPNGVIARYRVKELQVVRDDSGQVQFVYPKIAESLYYGTPPNDLTKEPSARYEFTVNTVKINNVPDNDLPLDPGGASMIWDADHKTYITISK